MKTATFYAIALIVLASDQFTKQWALIHLSDRGVPVLGSFLVLSLTNNTGGAFGLFPAKNGIFIAIAIIAIFALIYSFHRIQPRNLLVSAALALALGGAAGNLIDRVRLHYVVDFFYLKFWPVFNVADSAISLGIILLVIHFLVDRTRS